MPFRLTSQIAIRWINDKGDETVKLTYKELDIKTTRLAQYLRAPDGSESHALPCFFFMFTSCKSYVYYRKYSTNLIHFKFFMYTFSAKVNAGDRVLLVYPPSLDFIVAFIACLRASIVAVPVFPPGNEHKSIYLISYQVSMA